MRKWVRACARALALAAVAVAVGIVPCAGAGELRGTILTREGKAIPHAWAVLLGVTPARPAWTDSLGHFAIPGLDDHVSYSVLVGATGYEHLANGPFGPLGTANDPVFKLYPDETDPKRIGLVVTVVDPVGNPVPGAWVGGSVGMPQTTDFAGEAAFEYESAPGYDLEARAPGYARSVALDVLGRPPLVTRCTIRMARGTTLDGEVAAPAGRGAPLTLTVVRLDAANDRELADGDYAVDSTGHYHVALLTPDADYRIFARMPVNPALGAAEGLLVHTPADGRSVRAPKLRVDPVYTVSGRYAATDTSRIAGGQWISYSRDVAYANGGSRFHEESKVQTDATGRFVIAGVPAGRIELESVAYGRIAAPKDSGPLRYNGKNGRWALDVKGDVRGLVVPVAPAPPQMREYNVKRRYR